ncbi:MAG: hypothetical protein ACERKZ_12910 [Lachnotalea sp.]
MTAILLNEYQFGDMIARYFIDTETKNVELILVPVGIKSVDWGEKKQAVDSLVQLKIVRDSYLGAYAGGGTMRQGESVSLLKYKDQRFESKDDREEVITVLEDDRGYEVEHYLYWYKNSQSVNVFTKFYNNGKETVTLEMLSSFSLGGITPFVEGAAYDLLNIHRLRSVWSMEGRLETKTIEELQLEPSWAGHGVRCERFGQVGSMAVNRYFPFLAVEDVENEVLWGAQLAHNASWQMEIFERMTDYRFLEA